MAGTGGGELPLVLVANDDGIEAAGLRALVRALADASPPLCRVAVAAPSGERSASSQHITVTPVEVEPAAVPGAAAAVSVNGFPADCVMAAIAGGAVVFEGQEEGLGGGWRTPDLVLSGINRGSNCGRNVWYSGTLAAAREAAMRGVPAVALSAETTSREESGYEAAAQAAVLVARRVLVAAENGVWPKDCVLNVNFPAGSEPGRTLTAVPTVTGRDMVLAGYEEVPGSKRKGALRTIRQTGVHVAEDKEEGTDGAAVRAGLVSVSIVGLVQDHFGMPEAIGSLRAIYTPERGATAGDVAAAVLLTAEAAQADAEDGGVEDEDEDDLAL